MTLDYPPLLLKSDSLTNPGEVILMAGPVVKPIC